MDTSITTQDWYELLVDDCKSIITEAVFTSRWALVEGYWQNIERFFNGRIYELYKILLQETNKRIYSGRTSAGKRTLEISAC